MACVSVKFTLVFFKFILLPTIHLIDSNNQIKNPYLPLSLIQDVAILEPLHIHSRTGRGVRVQKSSLARSSKTALRTCC